MKVLAATLTLVAAGAWAHDKKQHARWTVTVCLNPGGFAIPIYRAEASASNILKDAGVQINWQGDQRVCAPFGNGILVMVSERTPPERKPGALASAQQYDDTHVTVFYDRILSSVRPDGVATLLGHVLAHEIVHRLQGVAVHTPQGLMKAYWDNRDLLEMQRSSYRLTEFDIRLIHRGLEKLSRGSAVQ